MPVKKKKVDKRKLNNGEQLKPWHFKKGQKNGGRNHKGRRGLPSLTKILRSQFDVPAVMVPEIKERCEELGLDPFRTTVGAIISFAMITQAIKGDSKMTKQILEAIESRNYMARYEITEVASEIINVIHEHVPEGKARRKIGEQITAIVTRDD